MKTQRQVDLEYLNHIIRNTIQKIKGCLLEAEGYLKDVKKAVGEYDNTWKKGGEKEWQSRVQEERLEVEEKEKVSEQAEAKVQLESLSQLKEEEDEENFVDIAY